MLMAWLYLMSREIQAAEFTLRGIDVSSYQGAIDWEAVATDDVNFAFIRCKSAITDVDELFDYNMENAIKNGIPVSTYYYSGATTDEEIKAETMYILKKVQPYKISLPIVLDIEGPEMAALSQERLQRNIQIFSDLITQAGYTPMIYSGSYFFRDHIGQIPTRKWIACYKSNCIGKDAMTRYWQYSSKGKVNGIVGNVDLNYFYVSTISTNKIR